jgi:hypothetical protein
MNCRGMDERPGPILLEVVCDRRRLIRFATQDAVPRRGGSLTVNLGGKSRQGTGCTNGCWNHAADRQRSSSGARVAADSAAAGLADRWDAEWSDFLALFAPRITLVTISAIEEVAAKPIGF